MRIQILKNNLLVTDWYLQTYTIVAKIIHQR